jgi:hypothetical protein
MAIAELANIVDEIADWVGVDDADHFCLVLGVVGVEEGAVEY